MNATALIRNNDLIENPVPRCACVLVLDTSGSMDGEPIAQLNEGVRTFIEATKRDETARYSVEVSVITFGGRVKDISPMTPVHLIEQIDHLHADGSTPMGEAVELALRRLEERKAEYKRSGTSYYQPWLVIMSDGTPTDSWQIAAQQSSSAEQQGRLVVMPIGVGGGADLATLSAFSGKRGAKALGGLKFNDFFLWLSASMSRVSASTPGEKVVLPASNGWDAI
ncbi:vWA domain-containing protein [Chitinilyticum piscinae]|uniref:VWA domain-containing protein n=1 Tax=Chitinilyticum piscinae TaxID=2866724 RepID=A0A8J7FMF3_9NEIS|nr:VWA domain-containing protein [Chitinilyticum piscinae]MBE9610832.1 VWA domain-containing protein [Chitinilyticum piscinae]